MTFSLLLACAGGQNEAEQTPEKPRVLISEEFLAEDESAALSWLAYGLYWRKRLDTVGDDPLTFEEELTARELTAKVAAKMKSEGDLTNEYLLEFLAIREAGLLREYVFHCVPYGDWVEPADLRTQQFEEWMAAHLPKHRVITMVALVYPEPGKVDVGVREGRHAPAACPR